MSAFSREIRSFVVVSQSSSIREAATLLNISAPALGRQMQNLEDRYGCALITRSAAGIALTAEGATLRDKALGWLSDDANLARKLHSGAARRGLRIRLGLMEGLVADLVPPLVERLEARFGPVELDLSVGSTDGLIGRADTQDIDVIVAFNMPRLARLVVVRSDEYHLGVVHAPGYGPPDDGAPLALSTALEWPLCLPNSALSMHTRLLAEILSVRVNPLVALSTNSIGALLAHLKARRGLAFLTWLDVCGEVEAGNLVFRPLKSRRLTETLSLAICRGNVLGEATGDVVGAIESVLWEMGR